MKIGFFLGYSPRTKFSNQGLGRQFVHLVEGFQSFTKEPVVIICPAWLRSEVSGLFSTLPPGSVEIIGNKHIPPLLRAYLRFRPVVSAASGDGALKRVVKRGRSAYLRARRALGAALTRGLASESLPVVALTVLLSLLVVAVAVPILAPLTLIAAFIVGMGYLGHRYRWGERPLQIVKEAIPQLRLRLMQFEGERPPSIRRLIYDRISSRELERMMVEMQKRADIDIWYSPTIFWPAVNSAPVPTVQCFPDLMMADFPTSFAVNYPSSMAQFRQAQLAVQTGKHFIAYSHATAKSGLQDRYDIPAERIHVIPHAPIDLEPLIAVRGTLDDAYARRKFATNLIEGHRNVRWQGNEYLKNFSFADTQYLFYASQLRPNKNALNLVKAYEILLRERYKYVKLILTANLADDHELHDYIYRRRLQYDIITAHDVPPQVLAALYHRAELAVNPSLFEGGMPFTFSEALSVGTPVVMSRIPQTTEVLGTGELADLSLFDPLSPIDIADKMSFGLQNRHILLEHQMAAYQNLKARTWQNVAEDHISAFQRILASA